MGSEFECLVLSPHCKVKENECNSCVAQTSTYRAEEKTDHVDRKNVTIAEAWKS